jgi:hypothetical protein
MSAAKNPTIKWARHARTCAMRRARKAPQHVRRVHVEVARVANRKLVAALRDAKVQS